MRKSAEKEAYNYIRQAIISRQLLPNEQVVEQNIAEQTGISRTPIRSALKLLNHEGLVVLRPNRGAFVSNPSPKEVRDLYECKLILEIETVRLACAHITDENIMELRHIWEQSCEFHSKRLHYYFLNFNYEFHMVIAKASCNKMLEKYNHELLTYANAALLKYDDFREVPLEEMESFKEHQRIIDALCARDKDAAEQAVFDHLMNTYETFHLDLPLRCGHQIG